jgi:hypothetical protein
MRNRIGAALVLLGVLALPLRTSAQTMVADAHGRESNAYRSAIATALQEFELGNYAEAREQFRVAHKLAPSARTLRGLGVTEYELRNYPESVRYLEQALASDEKPLDGAMRKHAEEVLYRAQGYVGVVSLEVKPEHADVTLNGQPIELSRGSLLLPVGDHVLEFAATGHATQRRSTTVNGRERQTIRVVLTALVTAPQSEPAAMTADRRPSDPPVYRRWWLWTSVGLVAVAGGVTTALLVRRSRDGDSEVRPTKSPNVPRGFEGGLTLPSPD